MPYKYPIQRWYIAATNPEKIEGLAREMGLSSLLATILINRGIDTPELAKTYIDP
jgi:single-stranded-DNA-specific exonuclease